MRLGGGLGEPQCVHRLAKSSCQRQTGRNYLIGREPLQGPWFRDGVCGSNRLGGGPAEYRAEAPSEQIVVVGQVLAAEVNIGYESFVNTQVLFPNPSAPHLPRLYPLPSHSCAQSTKWWHTLWSVHVDQRLQRCGCAEGHGPTLQLGSSRTAERSAEVSPADPPPPAAPGAAAEGERPQGEQPAGRGGGGGVLHEGLPASGP